jgi:fructose-1-phosphate kinase PfkB-like protein
MKNQPPLPLMQPKINTKNTHGTGCTLSAAIAAYLGLGLDLPKAVRAAQNMSTSLCALPLILAKDRDRQTILLHYFESKGEKKLWKHSNPLDKHLQTPREWQN